MGKFAPDFLLGAATAAHQVEGNNVHSDYWAMEQMEHSSFAEPSLDAVDHFNRYAEDIGLLAKAGLNAYRFSIEWARIEPEQGHFDVEQVEHYRKVIQCCHDNRVTPIVTMHHFSSPKWLITAGGWENTDTINSFARYCGYVAEQLGNKLKYVCTINEANMGLQLDAIAKDFMKQMGLQVGVDFQPPESMIEQMKEKAHVFGLQDPRAVYDFLTTRTPAGDALIMNAHEAARDAMKEKCPHLKIGITLSLHDFQPIPGGEKVAERDWNDEFVHYLPYLQKDDFIGVQNYTRKIIGENGSVPVPEGTELTEMDYEFYPESIGNVVRRVHKALPIPVIITENGVATQDDTRRVVFINRAMESIQQCISDGIPLLGYTYWSLLDNFEWQRGFSKHFGLIAVDRNNQTRHPKPSLMALGDYRR